MEITRILDHERKSGMGAVYLADINHLDIYNQTYDINNVKLIKFNPIDNIITLGSMNGPLGAQTLIEVKELERLKSQHNNLDMESTKLIKKLSLENEVYKKAILKYSEKCDELKKLKNKIKLFNEISKRLAVDCDTHDLYNHAHFFLPEIEGYYDDTGYESS